MNNTVRHLDTAQKALTHQLMNTMSSTILVQRALLALLSMVITCAVAEAATYNARLSATTVHLNQPVELTFHTPKAQRQIDISASLHQQLSAIAVRDHWAVMSIDHQAHERMGDVSVTIVLRPRHKGELPAPELTPDWLEQSAALMLPPVTVMDNIALANETAPRPVEIDRVHGFPWSMPLADLREVHGITAEKDASGLFNVAPGLKLSFTNGQLAGAHLSLQGVSLSEALPSLQERWGHAASLEPEQATWLLGWIHISATAGSDATQIVLEHQGINRQAHAAQVETDIFRVLEGPQTTNDSGPRSQEELEAGFEASSLNRLRNAEATLNENR